MTDQQSAFPPPAARHTQQKPTVRHWDGNGWTQPTPMAAPSASPARSASTAKRARKAS